MATPLPWSHSSLESHNTCERKFEYEKVLKLVEDVKNPASLWGDEVHKAFESHLREAEPLPTNMAQYQSYIDQYKNRPGTLLVEQMYAIDKTLRPCDFYAKGIVWGRGIIDVLLIHGTEAWVDDHKTGKRKYNRQQLIIFALLVFYHHPEVNTVHTSYRWLQTNEVDSETYYRHQIPDMWGEILPRLQAYARSFHSGTFRPKQSGLCRRHCAVVDCEYHGGTR